VNNTVYYSDGIVVTCYGGMWCAEVSYSDPSATMAPPPSVPVAGILQARNLSYDGEDPGLRLAAVIDAVKRDADRLGIEFRAGATGGPRVYYRTLHDHAIAVPPANWRGLIAEQAERLGWKPLYVTEKR
jgi:hypothetical protein